MSEPTLTPQTPGQLPGTDSAKIDSLASAGVDAILAALPGLDDYELDQLEASERAGKARTTALGAIIRERARREADDGEAEVAQQAAGGTSFAHLPASAVDPRTITANVLTRDGWVCPHPSAVQQG